MSEKNSENISQDNLKFRNLIENSVDIIYRMSLPDGNYEYINSAVTDITGYTPQEFYNNPLLISSIIHPAWKNYFYEQWEKLINGEFQPYYEFQLTHKSGDVRWIFQKNVLIRDENGNPLAIEGIASDITQRKNTETKLRESEARLLEAQKIAHIGNWYWDVKTGEVEWSDEIYRIFKLDPHAFKPEIDTILSLSPWEEDNRRDKELIEKAVKSREKGSYEQRFLLPDGSTGYYFSSFQGDYNENGELTAIKGTIQDITERKRTEKEKAYLEEQYRQAQKVESIGRLAGGVAHDLNNMLTPILGYTEMLLDYYSPDDLAREFILEIKDAGVRAKNLVSQLLAFSRKQTLEYKTIDMGEVVKGIENLLRHTIMENIKIKIITPDSPLTLRADKSQIEQVIMNIVINAQDAMKEGGVVTIESRLIKFETKFSENHNSYDSGSYVMLAISDSGCGMDESTKEKIFDPFFSTKGEMGTGLGLATVYGIVKQHGGSIYVKSQIGNGTTFKIYLPFHCEKVVSEENFKERSSDLNGTETILLAEDNSHVRKLAAEVLKKYGYNVIEAGDGDEALDVVRRLNGPVDLLLTDVVMPGMNGRELFTKISGIYPLLRVIYFSGYTDDIIAHHGVLDEGIEFIQKPFSSEGLAGKIREILDR